uniref:Inhibitor of apoptosis 1 n=1 Tax=Sinohyriopsis schlegelii TaxID=2706150 RepID=A0A2H4UL81_SINSH|nr:inhibitor of apoptosis 1 [Sinohyriopsis schlegelii]
MDNTTDRMKNEWARYVTFGSFPRSSPVQPTRLAQSGFYYSGTVDEAICFSCGLKHRNWKEGDSPFHVHKKLSPNCDFVNGSGDGNMPIRRRGTDSVLGASSLTSLEDKDKAVTHYNNSAENLNLNNRNGSEIKTNLFSALDRTRNEEQSGNDVKTENSELVIISNFTGDSSVQDKKKESENTKTKLSERANGQPEISQNNIKIAECPVSFGTTNGSGRSNTVTNEVVGSKYAQGEQQSSRSRNSTLDVSFEKPKHPHYSVLTSRLESFRGWPSYMQQKPADLASAGFYYVGVGDCVRCFFCGGGLRSWEEGDNPWEEHAQWYPNCAYLKQCKGDDFVLSQLTGINLRSKETLQIEPNDDVILEERSEDIACRMRVGSEAREMDPEDPMDCPAAKSILYMGYDTEMVKQAMQILTSRNGHAKFSATDIIEIIFQQEEKETKLHVTEVSDPSNDTARIQTDASTQYSVSKTKDMSVNEKEKSDNDSKLQHNNSMEEKKNDQSLGSNMSPEELKSLLKQNKELKDQMTCKICMDREACIVFLPCSHMMACPQCAPAFRKCPVCRQLIRGTVRAYVS